MTKQALPGRPPVHDLSAFDLSKRSPEQVAQSFARWKAQRKRQAEAGPARAEPLPAPKPAVAETGDAASGETKRASAKQARSLQYSAPFSDLLAAGYEPAVQRTDLAPVVAVRPQRTPAPGRRLKVMSILAGTASVLALAGGALLELADWLDPAAPAPQVTQVRPKETPLALAAVATSSPAVEWTLRHTVDAALMKAAPDAARPTAETPTPAIRTASKPAPVAGDKPVLPERKSTAPETEQFVAKPFVPDVAPAPVRMPAAQAAAPSQAPPVAAAFHAGDPRPDALFQHNRDNRGAVASNRTGSNGSASGGKPAAAAGMGSAVDARSASARKGTSGGSADPRGEVSGGAQVGTPSDASSGGESDAGDDGDASGDSASSGGGSGSEAADGGDTAGDGAGDAGAGDTGADGGDTAGDGTGDAGADGATGGDASGDAGDGGDSDAGETESSGIGGAVGDAQDAVGDALGGATGDGKGNPDSNDKDQRN